MSIVQLIWKTQFKGNDQSFLISDYFLKMFPVTSHCLSQRRAADKVLIAEHYCIFIFIE